MTAPTDEEILAIAGTYAIIKTDGFRFSDQSTIDFYRRARVDAIRDARLAFMSAVHDERVHPDDPPDPTDTSYNAAISDAAGAICAPEIE